MDQRPFHLFSIGEVHASVLRHGLHRLVVLIWLALSVAVEGVTFEHIEVPFELRLLLLDVWLALVTVVPASDIGRGFIASGLAILAAIF